MAEGGKILAEVMSQTLKKAVSGMTTRELDAFADDLIVKSGGKASFKMVKGYKHATCMCVNEVVVHGIPGNYALKTGDILGIDCGVFYKGFHTDASWTILVHGSQISNLKSQNKNIRENPLEIRENPKDRFLRIGKEALEAAISAAHVGNYVWDISAAIQDVIEKKGGYHSVHSLTGHGVGRSLHEDPFIPCFREGEREKSAQLENGMTLAIEVIYGQKTGKVWYLSDDGWTIGTRDGSWAGLYEQTIAIVGGKARMLTSIAKEQAF